MPYGINPLEQNNSIHVNENLVIHFSEAKFYLAFHLTLSYNMKISFCYLYNWRIRVQDNLLCEMAGFCPKCLHLLVFICLIISFPLWWMQTVRVICFDQICVCEILSGKTICILKNPENREWHYSLGFGWGFLSPCAGPRETLYIYM